MAKAFFNEHHIEYIEKDVSNDQALQEESIAKSHQMGVPVIEIGDQIIGGFQKEKLSELLGITA